MQMRNHRQFAKALCAAATLVLWARPLPAQTFFPESEALRPGSAIELTLADLIDDSRTESTAGSERSEVEFSLRRLSGRYRHAWFGFGAMGEARAFEERTDSFFQRDERDQSAGYLALILEGLLADDDGLFVVLSGGSRNEAFTFETFRRDQDSDTLGQVGIVDRLAIVVAGVIRGRERVRLNIVDAGFRLIEETYEFDYEALLTGVIMGDVESFGLSHVWQRKETPAATGTVVDREERFEELRRAVLGLGILQVEFVETLFSEAFTRESFRRSRERDVSLGIRFAENFTLGASQRSIVDTQGFTLLGIPIVDRTDRTENLLRLILRL